MMPRPDPRVQAVADTATAAARLSRSVRAAAASVSRRLLWATTVAIGLWLAVRLVRAPLTLGEVVASVALLGATLVVVGKRRRRRAGACACNEPWPTEGGRRRPLVVLVHGTFAAHADWVQPGSTLREELQEADMPAAADVVAYCWGGANTHLSRLSAATELAQRIDTCGDRPCFVIGHSHGGNIAVLAAGRTRRPVAGVATLATPFLHFSAGHFSRNRVWPLLLILMAIAWWEVLSPWLDLHTRLSFYHVLGGWFALAAFALYLFLVVFFDTRLIERLKRTNRAAGRSWRLPWFRGALNLLVAPFFVVGAVGAFLVLAEFDGRIPSAAMWVRNLAIVCALAIGLFGLHTVLTARRLVGAANGLWRFFWKAPPARVAAGLNPQDRRGCPTYVVTGLADEAAGGLFFAQFLSMLTRPLLGLANRLFLAAGTVLGLLISTAVFSWVIAQDGTPALFIERAVRWVNGGELHPDFVNYRTEADEFRAFIEFLIVSLWLPVVLVLAGCVLAVSLMHSLALFATGTDVPLLSLRALPIVQQAPVGYSSITTADLSGVGSGLHHSRVYGTRTGIGAWIATQMDASRTRGIASRDRSSVTGGEASSRPG